MKNISETVHYKDFIFRAIACLIAAHMIVMMGRPDLTSHEALHLPAYYPRLLVNYAIALIVAFAIKKVTVALDRRYAWYGDVWRRALLQFVFGILAVSMLSYLLVLIYFYARGRDMLASGYLHIELPFSIALIIILNLYYAVYYFYVYARAVLQPAGLPGNNGTVEKEYRIVRDGVPLQLPEDSVRGPLAEGTFSLRGRKEAEDIVILDTPYGSMPIRLRDVAMFFIYDKMVFLRMKGMASFNDCHQLSMTLTEIWSMVDKALFFQINRQCIINIAVVETYVPQGNHRPMLLSLKPEYSKLEQIAPAHWSGLCVVAGRKGAAFRKWLGRWPQGQ